MQNTLRLIFTFSCSKCYHVDQHDEEAYHNDGNDDHNDDDDDDDRHLCSCV